MEIRAAGAPSAPSDASYLVLRVLSIVCGIVILAQGVWAGVFLQRDGARNPRWIDVHATGAHVATILTAVTLLWTLWRLRVRRDLIRGAVLLFVLTLLESYVGGLIRDDQKFALTVLHVPLAMVLVGVVVWLPITALPIQRD